MALETGEFSKPIQGLAVSPNGRQAAFYARSGFYLAELNASGTLENRKGLGNNPFPNSEEAPWAAFSSNSRHLAAAAANASAEEWDIAVWDVVVNAIAFSPDGLRLASASEDKTIRVWEVDIR